MTRARTFDEHVNALADYMPDGALFEGKRIADSNFRQLLRGFTHELFTAQGYLRELYAEYPPDDTTVFLSEWEAALGIPDECFGGGGTNIERRRDILVKLVGSGLQTADDFDYLADVFGESVTVIPGSEYTGYPFAVADDQKRYYIIVEYTAAPGAGFPYTFPFTFGSGGLSVLNCLLEKLKPSNCRVLVRPAATPPPPGDHIELEAGGDFVLLETGDYILLEGP